MRPLLALAALAIAAAPAAAADKLKPAEEAAIRHAAERGRLLFEVDRAAWVTTDDMLAKLGNERNVPIRGWVVERDSAPSSYVVTYFGDGPSGPVAWYVGRVRDNRFASGELLPAASRPPLTAAQSRIARAVDSARRQPGFPPCTNARPNAAAIPPDRTDGPVEVYLLTAMTESGVYPFGGHYLLRVGDDGKIVSSRKFTNACLNMREPDLPEGSKPVAAVVSHLLDPTPTEIHVFMSIWTGKPVYVPIKKRHWLVDGTTITLVQR